MSTQYLADQMYQESLHGFLLDDEYSEQEYGGSWYGLILNYADTGKSYILEQTQDGFIRFACIYESAEDARNAFDMMASDNETE